MTEPEVFADTYYWLGMLDRRDPYHEQVMGFSGRLRGRPIITSELVLIEFLDAVSGARFHLREGGVMLVESIRANPGITVMPLSQTTVTEALKTYSRCPVKVGHNGLKRSLGWSLTDCASFQIINERGIRDALTADHHFKQAGFVPLFQ